MFAKRKTTEPMEQQPENLDPTTSNQPVEAAAKPSILSGDEKLFLFLACMLIGFIGVLIGFVPLVAVAMIGPVIIAMLT